MSGKLRTSPNFSLNLSPDGRAFVAGSVEPYSQFWLSERERLLFALFGGRSGMTETDAIAALVTIQGQSSDTREIARIRSAIAGMHAAGVLVAREGELSRYGKTMARDYLIHRPFPQQLAKEIVSAGTIDSSSRILDLASGPGSLALELAHTSPHVSMMELSRGFTAAARNEAKKRGLVLNAINENCNRLAQHDGIYDVITISQAIHWLDDIALCKGVCRSLAANGSFFVVHGALSLKDTHPLSYILGDKTPLGDKQNSVFADDVRPLLRRLALLFEALDTPDVARHDPEHARAGLDPIVGESARLYRQVRPVDEGFARAFLSDRHIEALNVDPEDFWNDLKARCAAASPGDILGVQDWALLQFKRGGHGIDSAQWKPEPPINIAFP